MGGKRKPGMLIASKARFAMGPGPNDAGLSRWHLIRACEASLKRLRTDVIDLYQVHQWDGLTPLEETLEALDNLVRAGQGALRRLLQLLRLARDEGDGDRAPRRPHSRSCRSRSTTRLQAREAEYELIPISIDQKLGVLVWSPLAGGLLSGKHRRNKAAPDGTRLTAGWKEPPIADEGKLWDIVDELVAIGEARGVSAARIALAWLLGRPGVTSLIIGGRTEAQFKDNLAAAEVKLTAEERARLDKVSQPTLLYPYWHQALDGQRPPRPGRPVADQAALEVTRRAILPRKAGEGDRA